MDDEQGRNGAGGDDDVIGHRTGGVRGDRLAQLRQAQVVAVLEDEAAQVHAQVRERCVRDGALRQVPPDPSVAQLLGRLLLDRHPPVAHVNLHSTW